VRVLKEIGKDKKILIFYDQELDYLGALVPFDKRIPPRILSEIREVTLDPWRYVDGVGLLLDISAWANESGTDDALIQKLESKYNEILNQIYNLLERVAHSKKAKRKKRRKRRKTKK